MSLFFQIGLLVVGLAALALIFRVLRQPLLPVYLLAGFLLGPVLRIIPSEQMPLLESFSLIGIAFLLFLAGLELDLVAIFKNFKVALLGFLVGAINTLVFVLIFSRLPYFDFLGQGKIIFGVVLSFSSTLLVVKTLAEQNRLNTTLGYFSLAILLLQDLLAIFCLALVEDKSLSISEHLIGLGSLFLLAFTGGYLVFPRLFAFAAYSEELLFLLSLGVLFSFSMVSEYFGLSLAAGAFLGGLSLSPLLYRYEISSRMRPLRDFFVMLLFLTLGLQLDVASFKNLLIPFIILLSLTIALKPIIYMLLGFLSRFSRPLSVESGLIMGQSSEFSLTVSHSLSNQAFNLAGYNFLASSFFASYIFEYMDRLGLWLVKVWDRVLPLSLFKKHIEDKELKTLSNHAVVFGGHRIGARLIKTLLKLKRKVILVDHNPDVISRYKNKVRTVYGDALEPEIREQVNLDKAALVVSTIPDFKTNLLLIKELNQKNPQAFIYVVAGDYSEALKLYEEGADFVILPYFLGAEQANILLEDFDQALERLAKTREEHLAKIIEESKQAGRK